MQMSRSEKMKQAYEYLERYDVFQSGQSLGYDIAAISHYADKKGCKISELTKDEVEQFATVQEDTEAKIAS